MKYFYGVLNIIGIILPYSQLIPWIMDGGFSVSRLYHEASESYISAFAWMDVLVTAVVAIGFILYEGIKHKIKHIWIPIVGIFTIGISFGLPMFLLLREIQKDKSASW